MKGISLRLVVGLTAALVAASSDKGLLPLGVKTEFLSSIQDKTRLVVRVTNRVNKKSKIRFRALMLRPV